MLFLDLPIFRKNRVPILFAFNFNTQRRKNVVTLGWQCEEQVYGETDNRILQMFTGKKRSDIV